MQNQQLKLIVNASKSAFEKEVNDYLKELDSKNILYTVTFTSNPWSIDGQAGTDFCAFIHSRNKFLGFPNYGHDLGENHTEEE